MNKYFEIIRVALSENRAKGEIYYEAHHIVPKSFGKRSSTVLLTPQEHYECHKLLAEELGKHPIYGKKMLWAFHRLAYDKGRKMTADQYAKARLLLMSLWTRKQTTGHKRKLSQSMKGNTNNSSRVFKGMKSDITTEGRQVLAEVARKRLTGRTGLQAAASKGTVILEHEDGTKIEAGSVVQLSKLVDIKQSTLGHRILHNPNKFIKGYKIYYK